MDPGTWRNISYIAVIAGVVLVSLGTTGTYYFTRRTEAVAPYRQPIRTATSTVEATILSDARVDTEYLDKGGTILFMKEGKVLLRMASHVSSARQTGSGQVVYRAVFNADPTDPSIGIPLKSLRETEYVFRKCLSRARSWAVRRSACSMGKSGSKSIFPPRTPARGCFSVAK